MSGSPLLDLSRIQARQRRLLKWLVGILATSAIVIGLTMIGFTVVMAKVPAYRAQLQTWLSQQAKLDIRFASVKATWRLYGPELRFTQAQVRSADGQRVLAIAEQGGVGLDLWQALRTMRWAAARFSLEGTELKVQRLANGQFELVGQADWPEFESNQAFELSALPVGELLISKVRISFRDLKTGRGPWALEQVTLDVHRDIQRGKDVLAVNGHATLPRSLGQKLNFSARGLGSLKDVASLVWQAEVAGTELDLAGWAQTMPADWLAPSAGHGSFRLQAALTGIHPNRIVTQLAFRDLQLKTPQWQTPLPVADPLQARSDDPEAVPVKAPLPRATLQSPPLLYRDVRVDVTANRSAQGWHAQIKNLQLQMDDAPWPATQGEIWLNRVEPEAPEQRAWLALATGHINHVVFNNLWPLLVYLPDNEGNARLRALSLSGQLAQFAFHYQRDAETANPRLGARGELIDVGVAPVGATPGVAGLSGTFMATGARGEFNLASRNMEVAMPRVFRTPLPVDEATGKITWTRDPQGTQLHVDALRIVNANGKAAARIALRIPADGSSPVIDMHATGDDLDAAAAPRYMPAGVMVQKTLRWLDNAFPTGRVQHAQATLTGPLRSFPFRDGKGLFLIKAHITDLTMDYQRGYLPAKQLVVDAEFRNQGMSAVFTGGDINGLKLVSAEGGIADFRDSEVRVNANLRGGLDRGLDYVQRSPVGPNIGALFQQLKGQGGLNAKATLFLPLKNTKQYRLDIDGDISDGRITLPDISEGISKLNGRLHVRNDAVTAAKFTGEFLQGRFTSDVEPVGRGQFNIVATGQVFAPGVMRFLKLPNWVQLAGSTRYRFTMPGYGGRDAQGVRRLYSVDSDLQGLSVALPEPAGKRAEQRRQLHIDADLRGADVMQLRGAADALRAVAQLHLVDERWQFDRGTVRADAVNAAVPAQPGLRVEGRIDQFTLDDWLRLGGNNTDNVNAAAPTKVQDVLRSANVTIGQFRYAGFVWRDLRALLQATDNGWRVDASNDDARGQVIVPYQFDTGRAVTLVMDELRLQPDETVATGAASDKKIDPRDLPSIDADIKHFRFGDHDFGALRVKAARSNKGLVVNEARISGDSFNGTGTGSWLQSAEGSLCSINITVESTDVRATMQRFNYGDFISGKSGKLIAKLSWPNGLDAQLLGRASGTLEFQLADGQLLSVQPGAGRVLGLLSVAALPRRLTLDFRDVTDKGLAYDSIHADFTVSNGDARTQNLTLRGPAAEVGIVGRMGLGVRDYDQIAVVSGDVGNALPVAGTALGGPVIGAALLLATKVFKEPLKGVARAYYHIGGSWDDPKVERIDADAAKASMSANDGNQSTGATP